MTLGKTGAVALAWLFALPSLAGDVKGAVKFSGPAPTLPSIPATRDQQVCGQTIQNETVEVAGGKLKNVVITLSGGSLPKPPPNKISIDQHQCRYHPHVQATSAGSTIEIINSDPLLHNIHGYLGAATVFNLAMPLKNQKIPKVLSKAGLVHIKCDIHNWMTAYVVVSDTPYSVDDDDGAFTIKDVPAGTYTVTAWQEKYGQKTAQVTVPASGSATVDFAFP